MDVTGVTPPHTTADESPLGDLGQQGGPPRRRWRGVLVVAGAAAGLLVAGYAAAALVLADEVPRETTVAGVALGGMSAAEAQRALEDGLADVAAQPVVVVAGETQGQVDPATVGLALDAEATVDTLTGVTFDPRVLLGHLVGLGEQPAVSTVDVADLEAAVGALAADLDLPAVEGAIAFDGDEPVVTEPVVGRVTDVEATAARIQEQWLEGEPVEAVTIDRAPVIGADAVETALTTLAEPLVSAPISVAVSTGPATTVAVDDLVAAVRIVPEGDALVLDVDGDALAATVLSRLPDVGTPATDATVVIENGAPVVKPAAPGVGLDVDGLEEAVAAAVVSGVDRTAQVELVETEPTVTTEAVQALGIVEKVAEFSTPMPYDPVRTQNLVTGTGIINGTIVMPGETFSLIEALGPITLDRGFTISHVVVDGNVSEAIGGGLSQLATTTYNAAHFAGMDDVFHKPHSRWFDRYPMGREATMFTPDIDLQWGNNTEHGILVQAWVADSRTHVALWSTKVWDVESVTGSPYAFTQPRTVYSTASTCTPESGGKRGFTVQVTRTRTREGQEPETQTWTTTYQPWNNIVCGPAPTGPAPTG